MTQAMIDAIVFWSAAFFLAGFTVGVIVKLLIGESK